MEVYQRMPLLRDASPGKGGLCGGVPEDAMHLLRDASPVKTKGGKCRGVPEDAKHITVYLEMLLCFY